MSWSFHAIGKPAAVMQKAAAEFERIKGYVGEPERTIAGHAFSAIVDALDAMPESSAVKIAASGSQSTINTGVTNNLSLSIEPLYGFVE